MDIPDNTPKGSFTHLVLYSKSSLEEQTIPAGVPMSDTGVSVAQLSFQDKDLDAGELGGAITWAPPSIAQVDRFVVYFATSTTGSGRSQLSLPVSAGTNTMQVPADVSKTSSLIWLSLQHPSLLNKLPQRRAPSVIPQRVWQACRSLTLILMSRNLVVQLSGHHQPQQPKSTIMLFTLLLSTVHRLGLQFLLGRTGWMFQPAHLRS